MAGAGCDGGVGGRVGMGAVGDVGRIAVTDAKLADYLIEKHQTSLESVDSLRLSRNILCV